MKRRMLQNQYYPQIPNNNYMMPQYQNYQNVPRQDSTNFSYVRDRAEAEQWPIATGSKLLFEDQGGSYFYIKTLGFGPNDRPLFIAYKKEEYPVQQETKQDSTLEQEINSTKLEMNCVKNDISELKEMLKELTSRPNYNKYDKKGGK